MARISCESYSPMPSEGTIRVHGNGCNPNASADERAKFSHKMQPEVLTAIIKDNPNDIVYRTEDMDEIGDVMNAVALHPNAPYVPEGGEMTAVYDKETFTVKDGTGYVDAQYFVKMDPYIRRKYALLNLSAMSAMQKAHPDSTVIATFNGAKECKGKKPSPRTLPADHWMISPIKAEHIEPVKDQVKGLRFDQKMIGRILPDILAQEAEEIPIEVDRNINRIIQDPKSPERFTVVLNMDIPQAKANVDDFIGVLDYIHDRVEARQDEILNNLPEKHREKFQSPGSYCLAIKEHMNDDGNKELRITCAPVGKGGAAGFERNGVVVDRKLEYPKVLTPEQEAENNARYLAALQAEMDDVQFNQPEILHLREPKNKQPVEIYNRAA
jgi:hypothetical protein